MIKFFRKIRQQLIAQNKFSKYLIYAIGKIFLVMIGILLALQVNNWNNNRIANSKEQAILMNLQVDFQNNIENFERTYNIFIEAYQASVNLLDIVKDTEIIDPVEVEQLIDDIINKTNSYDLITGAINEIFNTGRPIILILIALTKPRIRFQDSKNL